MVTNSANPDDAVAAARAVLALRYPGARFAIAAGSILRGDGTPTSDIDLVVVFERLEAAWREAFIAEGFPVEAFVHDLETLDWFMDQDVDRGAPSIVTMVADGRAIGADIAAAQSLQDRARKILAKGPLPLARERLDALRYRITDLVDDLRGGAPPAEMRAIGAELYQPLADLMLLGRGAWAGHGKWIPRLLARLDAQLHDRFDDAFARLAGGMADLVIALAEDELARHGGRFFAGDRRVAGAGMRRTGPPA